MRVAPGYLLFAMLHSAILVLLFLFFFFFLKKKRGKRFCPVGGVGGGGPPPPPPHPPPPPPPPPIGLRLGTIFGFLFFIKRSRLAPPSPRPCRPPPPPSPPLHPCISPDPTSTTGSHSTQPTDAKSRHKDTHAAETEDKRTMIYDARTNT